MDSAFYFLAATTVAGWSNLRLSGQFRAQSMHVLHVLVWHWLELFHFDVQMGRDCDGSGCVEHCL